MTDKIRINENQQNVVQGAGAQDCHLHIIDLNVPYPVDYGGLFDLFYKLPALQAEGVQIHLHCFDYGKGEQKELNKYCVSVNYYQRNKKLSSQLPYIVSSRKNEILLNNLLQDDYPILMEGIHCTYPLLDERFLYRKKFVRLHNVEFQYYSHLFESAISPFKKTYYFFESRLLKKYERSIVNKATAFWAVTPKDAEVYRHELGCTNIKYLPLFLPPWNVKSMPGMGVYCLYHGNLEVDENEQAATWLTTSVFNELKMPLVIAGKNPSIRLQRLVGKKENIRLVTNPSETEMQQMIQEAHIHVLPSFNSTGIKLKFLNALYNGRHCVVNNAMIGGTSLDDLCHVSNTASSMQHLIEQLYHQPFKEDEIELRKHVLHQAYNNEANAKQIVEWI
ncbi:MAG: glycosyltransferase [Ilyomonas sp.]